MSPPQLLLTLWACLRRPTAEDAYNWLQDLVSESGEEEASLLLSTAWLPLVSCSLIVYCLLLFYGIRIVYWLPGLFLFTARFARVSTTAHRVWRLFTPDGRLRALYS